MSDDTYTHTDRKEIKQLKAQIKALQDELKTEQQARAEQIAHAAAHASEESLSLQNAALDAAANAIVITDRQGRIIWVNSAFTHLTGYSRQEALDQNPRVLKSGQHDAAFYRNMWQTIMAGRVWHGEVVNRRKDGRLYTEEMTITPVPDAQGEIGHFIAIKQDITERQQAQEALNAQRAFLRQVLDINPDFVFVRDRQGRFVLANQAIASAYHTSIETMIGKSDADFNPNAEEVKHLQQDDLEVMDSLQEKIIPETNLTDASGVTRWVQTIKRPLIDEDGVARRVLGVSSDITRRKQLEQQVQASLERRSRQVQTSTEVAQEIAAAPALDELFDRVVRLIKERFGYYHAQIFHYEPALDAVVLVSGYGEAGQKMLARGHRLPMGRGVVGTAAATGQPILASDVAQDKDWRPNPDLPNTRGELAVPIKLRAQVLGILDVQSDQPGALSADDQLLLEGLCGQIAIAIDSTRLRQEMEERLRELNATYRAISREGWQTFREGSQLPDGYVFDRLDIHAQSAQALVLPELKQAIQQNALVQQAGQVAVAPLAARGEIIGALGVYDDPQQPLSPEDTSLIEQIAEQVAQAMESARLFEQTQSAFNESRALYTASASLNAAHTYDDILEAVRTHTIIGQADLNISINLFDRPWVGDDMPDWSIPITRWSSLSTQAVSSRYPLRSFPAARSLLRPEAPSVVSDVLNDPRLDDNTRTLYAQRFQARSTIFTPLVVAGQWIGYINAIYGQLTNFSEVELRRLTSITGQAAVAIQSIRQLEETQQRARQEQVLREITAAISASQEFLAQSLPDISWYLRELAPADIVGLITYTPGENEYTLLAISDETATQTTTQPGQHFPLKDSAVGWVLTHRQPRLDTDLRNQRTFKEDTQLVADGLAARLILPLAVGEQIIGALSLLSARPEAFGQDHVTLMEPLADQMALSLERVRLMENTRTALAEAEATHRRYLRQAWDSYLAGASDQTMGYMDGDFGLQPVAAGQDPLADRAMSGDKLIRTPLQVRGEHIGHLELYTEDVTQGWTEEERSLVEMLADQVAQALERARLFEDTQSRAQREHLIGEITSKIRASMDMETILQTTAEELAQTLGLSRASIRLHTGKKT